MGRLDRALGHRMWNQEEVEGAVDDFRLLNEPIVDVSPLRRVGDRRIGARTNLEEPLPHPLVHDDERMLRQLRRLLWSVKGVLLLNDLVELFQFMVDDLGPHRVTDTVPVDEDVVGQLALVVVPEGLEGTLEVALEHSRADDLLTFLTLRTCLGVVFAHVLIVSGAEPDDALLAFMANVDADQHRFPRDL